MRAVVVSKPGGPKVLEMRELASPVLEDDQILIKVAATAVNDIDLKIRRKKSSSNMILGLECSGRVVAVGQNVTKWKIGDQVCALLNDGGYAEEVAVPANQVLRAPSKFSLVQVAGLPMAACTAWLALFKYGKLNPGDTLLIHGFTEIAIFAIHIAKLIGVRVVLMLTDGTLLRMGKRFNFCCRRYRIRMDNFIPYDGRKDPKYMADDLRKNINRGRGADVILNIGGAFLKYCCMCLNVGGTLVVVDPRSYRAKAEIIYKTLLASNAEIEVFDRGALTIEEKAFVVNQVERDVWPAIEAGSIELLNHGILPLSNATKAHQLMNGYRGIHKILLTTSHGQDYEDYDTEESEE